MSQCRSKPLNCLIDRRRRRSGQYIVPSVYGDDAGLIGALALAGAGLKAADEPRPTTGVSSAPAAAAAMDPWIDGMTEQQGAEWRQRNRGVGGALRWLLGPERSAKIDASAGPADAFVKLLSGKPAVPAKL